MKNKVDCEEGDYKNEVIKISKREIFKPQKEKGMQFIVWQLMKSTQQNVGIFPQEVEVTI